MTNGVRYSCPDKIDQIWSRDFNLQLNKACTFTGLLERISGKSQSFFFVNVQFAGSAIYLFRAHSLF